LLEYSVGGKKEGGHRIVLWIIRRKKAVIFQFCARFCGKCASRNKFELLESKKLKKAKHSSYFTTSAIMILFLVNWLNYVLIEVYKCCGFVKINQWIFFIRPLFIKYGMKIQMRKNKQKTTTKTKTTTTAGTTITTTKQWGSPYYLELKTLEKNYNFDVLAARAWAQASIMAILCLKRAVIILLLWKIYLE